MSETNVVAASTIAVSRDFAMSHTFAAVTSLPSRIRPHAIEPIHTTARARRIAYAPGLQVHAAADRFALEDLLVGDEFPLIMLGRRERGCRNGRIGGQEHRHDAERPALVQPDQ